GYALGVVMLRAMARLHVGADALATPLLLSCAPSLLVAPRLSGRVIAMPAPDEPGALEARRAAGVILAAIAGTVAIASYTLAFGTPGSALETASIGTAALVVATLRRPSGALAAAATASLAIVHVAAVALLHGGGAAGWPEVGEFLVAPRVLPLAAI